MKKLAVLMPVYNAELYLNESIDSVLSQAYNNFDFFIINDCSTDNSEGLILKYNDKRIIYKRNASNLGIAKTLNNTIKNIYAEYNYIARMDADDWCYPNRLEKQIAFLNENKDLGLCGTQGYWLKNINIIPKINWEYPTSSDYIKYSLLFTACLGHSSVMFRSSVFDNNVYYNENIQTCEDWDLWSRIVNVTRISNLPDFLMKYRVSANSNHRLEINQKKHFEERSEVISNYWNQFGLQISQEEVFEFYYGDKNYSNKEFYSKLKRLIYLFNLIFEKAKIDLELIDRQQFSYLLSRRILDFWKRSRKSRWNLFIWFSIVYGLKINNKLKLIKNIIR